MPTRPCQRVRTLFRLLSERDHLHIAVVIEAWPAKRRRLRPTRVLSTHKNSMQSPISPQPRDMHVEARASFCPAKVKLKWVSQSTIGRRPACLAFEGMLLRNWRPGHRERWQNRLRRLLDSQVGSLGPNNRVAHHRRSHRRDECTKGPPQIGTTEAICK